jgi:23S rRNA pseudouridine2605 synthase
MPADPAMNQRMHLNRALSKLGLCSRTVANRWIAEGKVSVGGKTASGPDQWVELGRDLIAVAGPGMRAPDATGAARPRVYLRIYKPAGYVTTRSDELGRKTVYDLLPEEMRAGWVFPVGRLDKDSEGLLLMTDDGEWANRLTDPAYHVDKVYRVKLDGKPAAGELETFRTGVLVAGRKTLPAAVAEEGGGWYRVVLTEGRNRQIRKMFHALGYKVKRLIRVSIGTLQLEDLKPGEVRALGPERVREMAGTG